jgi:hypothetical protein
METISSMADTASRAIWGSGAKSDEEPVSGQQGAGTVNEPFDKGNQEIQPTNGSAKGPSEATTGDVAGDPTSGQQPVQKQQGADRPSEEPKSDSKIQMPHTDEEREKMVETGKFPHDPNDHSGEPLKMHTDGEKKQETEEIKTEGKTDRSKSVAHEGGGTHGKKEGTGTEYVKSSGLQADGGDFDATNPGAGAEANRLLEEHGVHKDKASAKPDDTSAVSQQSGQSGEEKVSKMQRLKEKLHIGKSS